MKNTLVRRFKIVFITFLLSYVALYAGEKKKTSVILTKRSVEVFRIFTALEQGLMGAKDAVKAEKLLIKVTGEERGWIVAVLASYYSRMCHAPDRALTFMAPEILPKAEARTWLKKIKDAETVRKRKWLNARVKATRERREPPERPTGLAVEFPTVSDVKITLTNGPVMLETARCLGKVGRIDSALKIIDACGRHFSQNDRFGLVQSWETLGDLNKTLQNFPKAKNGYQTALSIFKNVVKEAKRYGDKPTFTKWEQAVRKRIERKLAEINRLLDIAKYGKGYVDYRDAQNVRLKEKDYLRAILLYDTIIKTYSGTVYAEAARAYKMICLLEQSKRKTPSRTTSASVRKYEKLLLERKVFLKKAKRNKVPAESLKTINDTIKDIEVRITKAKAIPYGTLALKQARALCSNALKENRFGIYRGDMLCNLANHYLERMLDQEKAFEYYMDCWKWLKEVSAAKTTMAKFRVPRKASSISRPPATEKKTTGWSGWIVKSKIEPGKIVNRLSCDWYMNSLRARSGKMLSLCYFIQGKKDKALNAAKAIITYEPLERKMHKNNSPNSYDRLIRAYTLGWFRCLPDELKLFKGKTRTATVLGDFYYEVEDFEKCAAVRRSLTAGTYGKLNKNQMASALYRLAEVYFITDRDKECRALLEHIASKYKTCFSAADALIGLGNIYVAEGQKSKKALRIALKLYSAAAKVAKDPLREKAMFYEANALNWLGESKIALKKYRAVNAKYANGRFKSIIDEEIEKLNNKNGEKQK